MPRAQSKAPCDFLRIEKKEKASGELLATVAMLTGKGKVGKDKDTGKGKGKAHRRLASLETLSTPSDIVAEVRDYVTSINSW